MRVGPSRAWKRKPAGRSRRPRFEALEPRCVLSVPSLAPIADVTMYSGSPLHIPLDGFDADGDALTFTATSDNAQLTTFIPEGNRSMRISVASQDGAIQGDMVFELFEDRVPRATSHIIELAESGFYDGIIFHRVINGFMIQTGDPTGTGEGGSELGDFDDQFHVDLHHNRSGVLSMAKSIDDTNDSQFFITETATPHLNQNHTIFGQLVEGEAVREAISNVAVTETRPNSDVVMESVEIFFDQENAVLMLKPAPGFVGEANITVTVTDTQGGSPTPLVFHVTVLAEPSHGDFTYDPFLDDVPEVRTAVDTPVSVQLTATAVEEDPYYFLTETWLELGAPYYYVPFPAHADLNYDVGSNPEGISESGQLNVYPSNGLVGTHAVTVAMASFSPDLNGYQVVRERTDYQVIPIYIAPATPPSSTLDMTLVRDLTPTSALGEVATLPETQWIDEWDSFAIEIWARINDPGSYGVHQVSTELVYDTAHFTATHVEYGPEFREHADAVIDVGAGRVSQIAGSTRGVMIDRYYGGDDPYGLEFFGDDDYLLVARVFFEPNLEGPGVPIDALGHYQQPVTELGFAFQNAEIRWNSVDGTAVQAGTLAGAELWPVIYDIDDDEYVSVADLSFFAASYLRLVGDSGAKWAYASDFDHNGRVDVADLSFFAANYRRNADSPGRVVYPPNFPDAWRDPGDAGAALMSSPPGGAPARSTPALPQQGPQPWEYTLALAEALDSAPHDRPALRLQPRPVDLLMAFWGA